MTEGRVGHDILRMKHCRCLIEAAAVFCHYLAEKKKCAYICIDDCSQSAGPGCPRLEKDSGTESFFLLYPFRYNFLCHNLSLYLSGSNFYVNVALFFFIAKGGWRLIDNHRARTRRRHRLPSVLRRLHPRRQGVLRGDAVEIQSPFKDLDFRLAQVQALCYGRPAVISYSPFFDAED